MFGVESLIIWIERGELEEGFAKKHEGIQKCMAGNERFFPLAFKKHKNQLSVSSEL